MSPRATTTIRASPRFKFSLSLWKPELVSGLDTALIDQVEGSRLIVIVPPSLGFPSEGTMVFVVDVLDVWNPGE